MWQEASTPCHTPSFPPAASSGARLRVFRAPLPRAVPLVGKEWRVFATHTRGASDRGRAMFAVVLERFPPEAIEAFCSDVEPGSGERPVRPNLPLLRTWSRRFAI